MSRDELISLVKDSFRALKSHYDFSLENLQATFKDTELQIPATLFQEDGSPLSLVVHFLQKEGLHLKQIADRLSRSYRAIWGASRKIHCPGWIRLAPTNHFIPLSCFSDKLSIMESVVLYLKEHQRLTLHEIAIELGRDDRTVWTYHHRAKAK